MFCTNCGAPVEPGQKFCNKCGVPVSAGAVNINNAMPQQMQAQTYMKSQPYMQAQPKKKKVWPIVLLIAVIALVGAAALGFAGYTAYNAFRDYMIDTGRADVPYIDSPDEFDEYGNTPEVVTEPDIDVATAEESIEDGTVTEPDITVPDANTDIEDLLDEIYNGVGINYTDYAYAKVYDMDTNVLISPNDTVSDDTVIWNGKTLGGFCDFVDSQVLSEGTTVDRELLYKLVSIHVIDPAIVADDHIFEILMKYCVVVGNEFGHSGAAIKNAAFSKDKPNTYNYEVEVDGKTSTWIIDYDSKKVLLNNGNTEYTSAGEYGMFADKTMTAWTYIIDQYFGIY